jgi:UDP-N-acetylmuramyl pentapeptide phosphotransferase/UDP-N-acetylglucosamine-1-phosphate transferase
MSNLTLTAIFLCIICFYLFKYYINIASKLEFVDTPNLLSNHKKPVPTGAGIIFVFLICLIYLLLVIGSKFNYFIIDFPNRHYLFFIAVSLLGILSFIDDIKNIHPAYRFFAQIIIVFFSMPLLSYDIFYLIPEKLLYLVILLSWVYIINIFNFLDGSNGYLTVNSLFIFFGYLATKYIDATQIYDFNFLIILFFVQFLLIYLYFNFPKPKIFCGDSGSIITGYIIGYIILNLIFNGYWHVAISLISYPFFEVTITIIKKMKNGKYPWERLFDYFFLKALNATNQNHNKIFYMSLIYNLVNFIIILIMLFYENKYFFIFSIMLSIVKIYLFNLITKRNLVI